MPPNMGGALDARITRSDFTTHDHIASDDDSAQLTLPQTHQACPRLKFFIFGNNIAHSLSPTLHNTGFKELGLPHHYQIHETVAVDDGVREIMQRDDFGGASVTFPHKLQIGKYLESESRVAKLIGAVNTVCVRYGKDGRKELVGDNTDWLGIKSCIEVSWPTSKVDARAAVVVGAGGAARAACYALQELGIKTLYLINRTRSKAEELEKDFPTLEFVHYSSYTEFPEKVHPAPSIIVACVPADDFVEDDIPVGLFDDVENGVLVEMAYRPLVTALMKVAGRFTGWKVTRGVDVLKEQAYHQFFMWTGRKAPTAIMAAAVDVKC